MYATVASVLLVHLAGKVGRDSIKDDLEAIRSSQSTDGLFRDPAVDCPEAEVEDWWGWRHLTMHSLMALGLYGVVAKQEIKILEEFKNLNKLIDYLDTRNWTGRVDFTSNELQNLAVMFQYARDFQGDTAAAQPINIICDYIESRQDPESGLFGGPISSKEDLSRAVQAGYHFWLVLEYEGRAIGHPERAIDSILATQNVLGGYGLRLNSSVCDDIDSIDPLMRLSKRTNYRSEEVQASLTKALASLLSNFNGDGGAGFRRHEAMHYGYTDKMWSGVNESNVFFTWFRMLAVAYCLEALRSPPTNFQRTWHWGRSPGLQFL
jgi:hypothetical protein